jgi:hypothetical protein
MFRDIIFLLPYFILVILQMSMLCLMGIILGLTTSTMYIRDCIVKRYLFNNEYTIYN